MTTPTETIDTDRPEAQPASLSPRERRRLFMLSHNGAVARYRRRLVAVGAPPDAEDMAQHVAWSAEVLKRQSQLMAALKSQELARACMAAAEQAAEERCRGRGHVSNHAHQPGDPNCCDSCWVSMLDAGLNAIGGKPSIAGVAEA